ncbi:MAG: pyridoxal-phosphate dependent enzyme [Phycisphaerae bacterium]|nr:pyridoxal-phosphate dependent enzyme [Phycisphaerae bacterium]
MTQYAVTLADIERARDRIQAHVLRTPVLPAPDLSARCGRTVWAKCECLQHTGSFKIRGASSAVWALSDAAAAHGVLTHSSGNHGRALAHAAKARGIKAHVVMPRDSSKVKLDAVAELGAATYLCGPTEPERMAECDRVQAATGAEVVPPYNHPMVIAGQGTIALEILEQLPSAGTVVVPVGGGGMISGIAAAVRALRPGLRVVGAEPALADDAAEGKRTGTIAAQRPPVTIADGLRAPLGSLTFPMVRDLVDEIVTVSEAEIVAGMRLVMERMHLVIEPSAGVGVAALLSPSMRATAADDEARGPTVLVLCGGNANLAALPW